MDRWDKIFITIILALLLAFAMQARGTSLVVQGQDGCQPYWQQWAMNATAQLPEASWIVTPSAATIANTSAETLYAVSHGYYGQMHQQCGDSLSASDLGRQQFGFAFYAMCDGMCSTARDTFADAAVDSIGYCDMAEAYCLDCWYGHALPFQDQVFQGLQQGLEPGAAYDAAMNSHPQCLPCIRYYSNPVVEVPPPPKENIVIATIIPILIMRGN